MASVTQYWAIERLKRFGIVRIRTSNNKSENNRETENIIYQINCHQHLLYLKFVKWKILTL